MNNTTGADPTALSIALRVSVERNFLHAFAYGEMCCANGLFKYVAGRSLKERYEECVDAFFWQIEFKSGGRETLGRVRDKETPKRGD